MKTKNYNTSNAKRYKNRPGRTIVVDQMDWKYVVGSSNVIDPNAFDRGKWKHSQDGMVLPSEVAKWIRSHYVK